MRAGVHKPLVLAQYSGLHDAGMALLLVCAVLIESEGSSVKRQELYTSMSRDR